jgi:PhnB protein
MSAIDSKLGAVIPYLIVRDATAAIAFYVSGLGATEAFRLSMPDGKIGHAELRFGTDLVYLADEFPDQGYDGPQLGVWPSVSIVLHVADAKAAMDRAVSEGATVEQPLADNPFGARSGWIRDPFGHRWNFQQQLRDMTPADMQRAIDEGAEG